MNIRLWFTLLLVAIFLLGTFLFGRSIQNKKVSPTQKNESPHGKVFTPSPITLDKIFSEDHSWTAQLPAERKRVIIATGDVLPARVVNIKATEMNDYTWPYKKTADILKSADVTFINLETPLTKDCPLINSGFVFCGDERNVEGLKYAGVDIANLANNHTGNFDIEGINYTTELLKNNNILTTGRGSPTYMDIKGIRFAFLGYNDIGVQAGTINAQEEVIKNDIKTAKENAGVVIVQFHWGVEYTTTISDRQKQFGRLAVDEGADLIIGNHPHWIQPLEIYKDKLITYAHGNFVFDQEWSLETKQGVVGKYTFYDDKLVDVEFLPVQIEEFGQPYFLSGDSKKNILEKMKSESIKMAAGENKTQNSLWFKLHRKSNVEYLYEGVPGDETKSKVVRIFNVKTGRPGERPTPLPELLGKEYWIITAKKSSNNPETAPYFISLNVPYTNTEPFGPVPYEECNGQCNWILPGEFGLHGINGDLSRLAQENPGSSGCIRHTDADITYLYNLLEPAKNEIRYYISSI